MLQEAARDGLAAGPYGMADDCTSFAMPWGFDVADIAPHHGHDAREDRDIPRGHGVWIAAHVRDAASRSTAATSVPETSQMAASPGPPGGESKAA